MLFECPQSVIHLRLLHTCFGSVVRTGLIAIVMSRRLVTLVLLFGLVTAQYNILFLSPITASSHTAVVKSLAVALSQRGHNVTYWNGILKAEQQAASDGNLRMLYSPGLQAINNDHGIRFADRGKPFQLFLQFPQRIENYCRVVYRDPVFHQLMNSTQSASSYDLVVSEGTFNECLLPLVQRLAAPLVYINSYPPPPWLLKAAGTPQAFDLLPNPGLNFKDEMNFWQRTLNALSGLVISFFHSWFIMPVVDRVAAEMDVPNQMSARETEDRYLSLLLANIHHSINYQMPTSPGVVMVGGMHCVPPKPLPIVFMRKFKYYYHRRHSRLNVTFMYRIWQLSSTDRAMPGSSSSVSVRF